MEGHSQFLLSILREPAFYPHHPDEVSVIETHISWVFLAGDLVYKCKKPVRFDFLDFSTLDRRKQACEDEVRLNRRLAPQVYLGVVPVTQAGQCLQLNGTGPIVEWSVEMRRLPTAATLDQKLWRGELTSADITSLADLLRPFFQTCPPIAISPRLYREQLVAHVQQNRRELLAAAHQLPGEVIKRIHAAQLQLLQLHGEIFDERIRAGKIIEGHGDLRPEHICCGERPAIFDCLEFSSELRTLDVADELAFLAMECDHLGAPWIGAQLFDLLRAAIGEQTPAPLISFYKSYRACVRAKVAALRAEQLTGVAREAAVCQARNYLALADAYLADAEPPLLLAIGGLSGSGKSSLARSLGDALGAEVLRTDVIRRQLFPEVAASPLDGGAYQPASRAEVYAALLRQAEETLLARRPVILDATFADQEQISAAYAAARRAAAPFLAVECQCPADVAIQRMRARAAAGGDVSQADERVYHQQRQSWQPWPGGIPQKQVSTTLPVPASTEQVLQALERNRTAARGRR